MNDPLDHWPRLSETLTGPKDVDHCQSCGMLGWELWWSGPTTKCTGKEVAG